MDVEFFVEAVEDKAATVRASRPIVRDVIRVRIVSPQGTAITKNLDDTLIARFPDEWARFQAQQRRAAEGTPIEDWSYPSPALAVQLHELGLDTVEAIANLADDELAEIDDGAHLRRRARAFLDGGERERFLGQLVAENAGLRRQVAELERRNAALVDTLERWQLAALPADRPGQGMIMGVPVVAAEPPPPPVGRSALDGLAAGNLPVFRRRQQTPRAPVDDPRIKSGEAVEAVGEDGLRFEAEPTTRPPGAGDPGASALAAAAPDPQVLE